MNRKWLLLGALVFCWLNLLVADPALACTCGERDPRDRLAEADSAFVGLLVAQTHGEDSDSQELYEDLTFEVKESVKGSLPPTVTVRVYSGCPMELEIGATTGLLLFGESGEWQSDACGLMDADALRQAAAPLPEPDGSGGARFVVGGNYGETRLVVLDRKGRTLAYGYGDGAAIDIASCPGGDTFLELWTTVRAQWLTARDSQTADVLWQRRVWRRPSSDASSPDESFMLCDRATAASGLVGFGNGKSWTIRDVGPQGKVEVESGRGRLVGLASRHAYIEKSEGKRRLVEIDLGSGKSRFVLGLNGPVGTLARYDRATAVTTTTMNGVDLSLLRPGENPIGKALPKKFREAEMVWTGQGDLAVAPDPYAKRPRLLVFDSKLDVMARFGDWHSVDLGASADGIIGVGKGLVRKVSLSSWGTGFERLIPTPETYAIEALG